MSLPFYKTLLTLEHQLVQNIVIVLAGSRAAAAMRKFAKTARDKYGISSAPTTSDTLKSLPRKSARCGRERSVEA